MPYSCSVASELYVKINRCYFCMLLRGFVVSTLWSNLSWAIRILCCDIIIFYDSEFVPVLFCTFHHICNPSHVCAFNQDSVICMAFCCYFFGIILTYHAKTYSAMQCTDIFNQSAFRLLINTIKMVSSFVYRTVWWKPVELPCNVQGSALYCVPPYVKLLYKSAHWFLSIFKLISRDSSS